MIWLKIFPDENQFFGFIFILGWSGACERDFLPGLEKISLSLRKILLFYVRNINKNLTIYS